MSSNLNKYKSLLKDPNKMTFDEYNQLTSNLNDLNRRQESLLFEKLCKDKNAEFIIDLIDNRYEKYKIDNNDTNNIKGKYILSVLFNLFLHSYYDDDLFEILIDKYHNKISTSRILYKVSSTSNLSAFNIFKKYLNKDNIDPHDIIDDVLYLRDYIERESPIDPQDEVYNVRYIITKDLFAIAGNDNINYIFNFFDDQLGQSKYSKQAFNLAYQMLCENGKENILEQIGTFSNKSTTKMRKI